MVDTALHQRLTIHSVSRGRGRLVDYLDRPAAPFRVREPHAGIDHVDVDTGAFTRTVEIGLEGEPHGVERPGRVTTDVPGKSPPVVEVLRVERDRLRREVRRLLATVVDGQDRRMGPQREVVDRPALDEDGVPETDFGTWGLKTEDGDPVSSNVRLPTVQ